VSRFLTHEEAKAFYDRLGAKQDAQGFYEGPALDDLLKHSEFNQAHWVFEFGCGTGCFAEKLFKDPLSQECIYLGVDVSSTMVDLARDRLKPWGQRARIQLIDGSPQLKGLGNHYDRFVSTYVLDLLSPDDIEELLKSARRMLCPQGLLCLVSLTFGKSGIGKCVSRIWRWVCYLSPKRVGGCRPIRISEYLSPQQWQVQYHRTISSFGISSEIMVARRI
jgi:ubiquinone/menaquinone biosynthesis C-methylase UbiE